MTILLLTDLNSQEKERVVAVAGKIIWNEAPHNAFPDLERFNQFLFCAFREASSHRSKDGKIRVIKSIDGEEWESSSLLEFENCDLRDPNFSMTASGELMLNAAINYWENGENLYRQSVTWLSNDGHRWEGPYYCPTGVNTWRWDVAWNDSLGYSVAYTGKDKTGTLYSTRDGKQWHILKSNFFPEVVAYPNEAALVFDNDSVLYCLVRRDKGPQTGLLGKSIPPYSDWTWVDLGVRIGGPELEILDSGIILAGVRLYDNKKRMALCLLDAEEGKLSEVFSLESGNDTGYSGIIEENDSIWVSYYSSHEGNASIYLSKMSTDNIKR